MDETETKVLKALLSKWARLHETNIRREVLHCSFPFPCECCVEQELLKIGRELDEQDSGR